MADKDTETSQHPVLIIVVKDPVLVGEHGLFVMTLAVAL